MGVLAYISIDARWGRYREPPVAVELVLQTVDPTGVTAGHTHNLHVAEENDGGGQKERHSGHEDGVGGAAGPAHRTAEHGPHIFHLAPAQQRGTAGEGCLDPDPQDCCPGPPGCATRAVAQAVHYGVIAVHSNGSQGQNRGCAVH